MDLFENLSTLVTGSEITDEIIDCYEQSLVGKLEAKDARPIGTDSLESTYMHRNYSWREGRHFLQHYNQSRKKDSRSEYMLLSLI